MTFMSIKSKSVQFFNFPQGIVRVWSYLNCALSFGFTFLTAYITKLEGIFRKKKVYRVCLPQNFFLMFVRNLKRHTAFLFIQDKKSTIEWGVIQTMYKYYRCIALADFRLFDINASLWRQVFLGFITYLTITSDYHLNTQ